MTKLVLHSIGNEDSFSYYVFDKKQEVARKLSYIFYNAFKADYELEEDYDEKKDEVVVMGRNIEKYKDVHENVSSVHTFGSRIDIFYGDKKMFVTVLCSQKLRVKFNEELLKHFVMSKPVKLKKNEKKRK